MPIYIYIYIYILNYRERRYSDGLPWNLATSYRRYSDVLPSIQRRLSVDIATAYRRRYWSLSFSFQELPSLQRRPTRRSCHAIKGSSLLRRNSCHGKKNTQMWQYPCFSVDIATFYHGKIDHLYQCTDMKEQITDIFTKSLPKEAFDHLRHNLGVISLQ